MGAVVTCQWQHVYSTGRAKGVYYETCRPFSQREKTSGEASRATLGNGVPQKRAQAQGRKDEYNHKEAAVHAADRAGRVCVGLFWLSL